ncbi:hypothetical protein EJB05_24057, partial [Eragrostis curvula]
MASHTFVLLLLPFLFATAAAAADVAQGPTPQLSEANLTRILEKGEQYTTLLRLLNTTRVLDQLHGQLRDSYDGITFFAPTDSAFAKLSPGTLNALNDQDQTQLVLYHVLPRYYSLATFQTASNPLHTEASGPGGAYSVNVTTGTAAGSLVRVSTGVVAVPLSNTMLAEFPLAVYSLDDVLLPEQLFGGGKAATGKQASAPAPAAAARKKGAAPKSDVAAGPSAAEAPGMEEGDESSTNAAAERGSTVLAALALMVVVVNIVVA